MGSHKETYKDSFHQTKFVDLGEITVADADYLSPTQIDLNDYDGAATAAAAGEDLINAADLIVHLPKTGRNLRVTPVDAAGTSLALTLTFEGYDQFGKRVSETISVAGVTAADGEAIFTKITHIWVDSIANLAASDALDIGYGDDVGLPFITNDYDRTVITRTNGNADVILEGSSTYINRANKKLQAVGSGGSGVIGSGDHLFVRFQLEANDPDDRTVTLN